MLGLSKSRNDPDKLESLHDRSETGCGFVDLCPMWKEQATNQEAIGSSVDVTTKLYLFNSAEEFDQHGDAVESSAPTEEVRFDPWC